MTLWTRGTEEEKTDRVIAFRNRDEGRNNRIFAGLHIVQLVMVWVIGVHGWRVGKSLHDAGSPSQHLTEPQASVPWYALLSASSITNSSRFEKFELADTICELEREL
jgi:hypothetical protein